MQIDEVPFISLNRYLGTFIGTFDFIDISTFQGVN